MSLHQQEDAIQSTGNETLGFPLALNTILVLIFQSTQERITQPDPTGQYVHCTNGSAVFSPCLHVLPELKHPSCSTMGAAHVLMSFVPDASIGWHTRREAQFFTLLNVTAAEQKNSQQSA